MKTIPQKNQNAGSNEKGIAEARIIGWISFHIPIPFFSHFPDLILHCRHIFPSILRSGWLLVLFAVFRGVLPGQEEESFVIRSFVSAELPAYRVNCLLQDRQGFIWIGTFEGLYRFDGYHFRRYYQIAGDPNSLNNSMIYDLSEDPQGNIWLATNDGVSRLDPGTGHFTAFPFPAGEVEPDLRIRAVFADSRGSVWAGTYTGALYRMDSAGQNWELFPTGWPGNVAFTVDNSVRDFYEDAQGCLWIGSANGLGRFEYSTGVFSVFRYDSEDPKNLSNYIWSIFEDDEGALWLGTNGSGLHRFERETGRFTHLYRNEPGNPASLLNDAVFSICQDHAGRLWIAAFGGGLNCLDRRTGRFTAYTQQSPFPHNLNHNQVFFLLKDRQGLIWVGSDGGLNRLDFQSKPFRRYFYKPDHFFNPSASEAVNAIVEDKNGLLWLGTDNGLIRFDRETGDTVRYRHDPFDPASLGDNRIWSLLEGNKDDLWVGSWGGGVNRLDLRTGRVTRYQHAGGQQVTYLLKDSKGKIWASTLQRIQIYDEATDRFINFGAEGTPSCCIEGGSTMVEDRDGVIWISSYYTGLHRWDRRSGDFKHYQYDPANPDGLSSNSLWELFLASDGNLWIQAMGRGLDRLDPQTGRFRFYGMKDGLPTDRIMAIQEDERRRLWITGEAGLTCYDPQTGKFQNYDVADGLPSNEFSSRARFRSPRTGELFFGSINGLLIFHPDSIRPDTFRPPVVITSFSRYNRRSPENRPIVDDWIFGKKHLTLTHRDNVLSFEFAALNYRQPEGNRYAYQLEGFSDQWVDLGAKHDVMFTSLAPGRYTLRVKGANDDGIWNEQPAELSFRILPPWYWSWWSKLIYFLLLAGAAVQLYRLLLRRRLALAEAQRLAELDETKSRLYTNITHEFRTPLTVLLGMADRVTDDPKKWYHEGMTLIKRQGRHLLSLVNQMLDLSKLESGNMQLEMMQGEVVAFLKYLTDSFHSLAENKDLRLHLLATPEEICLDYNPDGLAKIVSNLLSNAIKFTPPGGDVYLLVETTKEEKNEAEILRLQVKDTGIGIPEEQLPRIFDRFYQVDNSTIRAGEGAGIGLALTRELVRLMGGQVTVASKVGEGSVFTVLLPVRREAPLAEGERFADFGGNGTWQETPEAAEELHAPADAGADLPLALLVEDHADVLTYLRSCLQDTYRLETARDGREGIRKAIELVPDIIISDVMMPEADGFELTRTLKEDERTSHIPILLLTARADRDSRLEGLERGADAYLAKPFDRKELEVRLRKLIDLRRKLLERYSGHDGRGLPVRKAGGRSTPDERFLNRLYETLDTHLEEEDFGINQLCEALGISRIQLHRKVKALAGTSASHFIRNYRLEKGRELLETTDLNISEVAYRVGFRNHSYFTECFRERYGMAPSEYRIQP